MALKLSNYSYRSPRRRGEGLRIGCARYLVRGVKRADYAKQDIMDAWLPAVAPSRALLAWVRKQEIDDPKVWKAFTRRYRAEMNGTDARETIHFLAQVARRTPISLGCYCTGERCHRFALERLVRKAAKESA